MLTVNPYSLSRGTQVFTRSGAFSILNFEQRTRVVLRPVFVQISNLKDGGPKMVAVNGFRHVTRIIT